MSADRYAVIGHPIAHSRSPQIHQYFAQHTGQQIQYEKLLAPLDGFIATLNAWRQSGGRGANITVPFKLEALALADQISARARIAGAANVLSFDRRGIAADNTDGTGLVRDIEDRLRFSIRGRSILILGAGGAARGVIQPLLEAGASAIHIANRTADRARALIASFPSEMRHHLSAGALTDCPRAQDLVINATSAGLSADASPQGAERLVGVQLAYDMVYGAQPTPFMIEAQTAGVSLISDGLGMLVEQAAESFLIWRGVRPATGPAYQAIRLELSPPCKDASL